MDGNGNVELSRNVRLEGRLDKKVKISFLGGVARMPVASDLGVLKKKGTISNNATTTAQSTPVRDPLATAFKGLPSKTRKDIQTALKEKRFLSIHH